MSGSGGDETIQARRQRRALVPRACEACSIRKIRCDRSFPCSNCRTSNITCKGARNPPETPPKPDKISQLIEAVERLDQRLDEIQGHITNQKNRPECASNHPVSCAAGTKHDTCDQSPSSTTGLYEGASSFTSLSIKATELANKTADNGGRKPSLDLGSAFNSLDTLLRSSNTLTTAHDYYFSRNPAPRNPPRIDLLPAGLVISILQSFNDRRPIFLSGYAINDSSFVKALCQAAYFPTEPVSVGHVTAMHGVLYFILKEYITLSHPLGKEYDLDSYLAKCEQTLNTGLESYDVLAVPSFENILALTMGAIKAQEEAKPLLCSTLISTVAGHCQMLGYHRERTYQVDRTGRVDQMRRLFWTVYVFDKNMSLLLGRSSCLQDSDIDARHPNLPNDPALRPWDESFLVAVKLAQFQGQIYDKLYSATASRSNPSDQQQWVQSLSAAMQELRAELENIDPKYASHPDIFELSRKHWDVMYYSTLTSLLRASPKLGPGLEISSQCFQSAQLSLQSHVRCFSGYQSLGFLTDNDYANWVLHYSSFTPFIVIFLHAIAVTSFEDVQLLDDVVKILRNMRSASKGSERLYQICATFSQLARRLVEDRLSCVGTYNQQENSLLFLDSQGQMPLSGSEIVHDSLGIGIDLGEYLVDWEGPDVSTILADWASGQATTVTMFGTDS